jgi:hypothetical protein
LVSSWASRKDGVDLYGGIATIGVFRWPSFLIYFQTQQNHFFGKKKTDLCVPNYFPLPFLAESSSYLLAEESSQGVKDSDFLSNNFGDV